MTDCSTVQHRCKAASEDFHAISADQADHGCQVGPSSSPLAPYLPHVPATRRYLSRKVPPSDIDDIIQDCLMRIMVAKPVADIQHPKSYLIMVARAVVVDRLRQDTRTRRKNHCELTDVYHPVDTLTPCRIMIGRQELSRVTTGLNAMPARTREMLMAVRIEGLSFKATADRFGVCVSTVEKQISKALAQLSNCA